MPQKILSREAIQQALAQLNEEATTSWEVINEKLHKSFVFGNFIEAFGFMTRSAMVAEKMNHHPEWCNSYNTVTVNLSTHESGGITGLDFALAGKMESFAQSLAGRLSPAR